jgi:glutamate/tyrosine decarboxylase-like PLP-dependent enzyme
MTAVHPGEVAPPSEAPSIAPIFTLESHRLPRRELPAWETAPEVAYQIIHDELMLDGNARLNVATFVTTWMEPQAERLMAELLRQEHDRQGRVPADCGARGPLRQHRGAALARPWYR